MDINIEQKLIKVLEEIDERYKGKKGKYTVAFIDLDKCRSEKDDLPQIVKDFLEEIPKVISCETHYLGRDEFLLFFEDCTIDKAMNLLMDLKYSWKGSPNNKHKITFSAGVASFPDYGDHASLVLTGSEEGLYRAKQSGRNMIMHPENEQKIMKSNYYYPYQLDRLKKIAQKTNRKEADILRIALNEFFRRHDEI